MQNRVGGGLSFSVIGANIWLFIVRCGCGDPDMAGLTLLATNDGHNYFS